MEGHVIGHLVGASGSGRLPAIVLPAAIALVVLCGVLGAMLSRRRGASVVAGGVIGLLFGPIGLLFVTKLPRNGLSLNSKKRKQALAEYVPPPIDPLVAQKYGLPPQVGSSEVGSSPAAEPTSPTPVAVDAALPDGFVPSPTPSEPVATWSPSGSTTPSAASANAALPTFGAATTGPEHAPSMSPVETPAPISPPPPTEGWWAADPYGRFPNRWWDGSVWTERVLDADSQEWTDSVG